MPGLPSADVLRSLLLVLSKLNRLLRILLCLTIFNFKSALRCFSFDLNFLDFCLFATNMDLESGSFLVLIKMGAASDLQLSSFTGKAGAFSSSGFDDCAEN